MLMTLDEVLFSVQYYSTGDVRGETRSLAFDAIQRWLGYLRGISYLHIIHIALKTCFSTGGYEQRACSALTLIRAVLSWYSIKNPFT